jgi:hypothetical protein
MAWRLDWSHGMAAGLEPWYSGWRLDWSPWHGGWTGAHGMAAGLEPMAWRLGLGAHGHGG